MAAKLLPYSVLTLATLSGFNYTTHYQHPSDPAKPYVLLIHGFPSSAYDWRHQVDYFSREGYGIIAPDTLGYGGTSKPTDPASYKLKGITNDIIEVVDRVSGNSSKVLGVGHDWGSALLSRLANYHSSRFLSYAFLAGSYSTPGPFDLDLVINETKSILGYSTLGYWKFFNESDAGPLIDSHKSSFDDLIYPANITSTWKEYMGPVNATKPWIVDDRHGPRASYVSEKEFAIHDSIFADGGYSPALNYYRATIAGLNTADEEAITSPNNTTSLPSLFISGSVDPLIISKGADEALLDFAPHAELQNVSAGHWVHLEQADQVNQILAAFFQRSGHTRHKSSLRPWFCYGRGFITHCRCKGQNCNRRHGNKTSVNLQYANQSSMHILCAHVS